MNGRRDTRAPALVTAAVSFARTAALIGIAGLLAAACTTRTLGSVRSPVAPGAGQGLTQHGFVDGELVLRFTPEGERTMAPFVGKTGGPLRFGVPSLDRLNAKYKASGLAPLTGERGAYVLTLSRDAHVVRAADEYGREPLVSAAEPNYLLRIRRPAEAPGAVRTEVKPGS